tara:strand:- start:5895 stop:11456 length:5562 start_codon:yes stop_codon:yes gene_type:complete
MTDSIIHNSFTFKIEYENSSSESLIITDSDTTGVSNFNDNIPYYINRFNEDAREIARSNERFIKLYHSPDPTNDEYTDNYIQYDPIPPASNCDSTYCADLNKIKENSLFNSITTLDASLDNSIDNSKYVFRDKMYCATECTNSNEKSAFESSDIKYIADEIMDDTYTKIIFKHDDSHQEPSSNENGWKGTIYTLNIERNTPSDDSELLDCSVLIVGGGGGGGGNCGGGGGGGSVVYIDNIELYSNTSYKIKVGKGGIGAYYNEAKSGYMINGETGYYSSIGNSIVALGGGGGGCNLETNKRLKNFEDIIDAKYTENKFKYQYSGEYYDLKFEGMDDNRDNDGKYGKGIDGGSGGGSCAWWCDVSDPTKTNKGKGKGKSYDNSAFKDYSRYHSEQNDGEVSYIDHTISGDDVYHPSGETKLIGVGGGGGGAGASGGTGEKGNGGDGKSIEEIKGIYCDIFNLDNNEGNRCFTQVSQEDNKIYNKKLIRERHTQPSSSINVLLGAGGGGGSLDKHPGKGGNGGGGSGGVYYREIIDSHSTTLTGYDISKIIGITNSSISSTTDNTKSINKNDIFIDTVNNKLEFIKYNRDTSRYCPKDILKLSEANASVDGQSEYINVQEILSKLSSELETSSDANVINIYLTSAVISAISDSENERTFLYNYIIQINGNKFYCKRQQPDGLPGTDNTGSGGGGGGLYGDGGKGGSGLVVLLIKSTDKIKGTQKPENELNITKDFRKTVDYFQLLKKDLGVNYNYLYNYNIKYHKDFYSFIDYLYQDRKDLENKYSVEDEKNLLNGVMSKRSDELRYNYDRNIEDYKLNLYFKILFDLKIDFDSFLFYKHDVSASTGSTERYKLNQNIFNYERILFLVIQILENLIYFINDKPNYYDIITNENLKIQFVNYNSIDSTFKYRSVSDELSDIYKSDIDSAKYFYKYDKEENTLKLYIKTEDKFNEYVDAGIQKYIDYDPDDATVFASYFEPGGYSINSEEHNNYTSVKELIDKIYNDNEIEIKDFIKVYLFTFLKKINEEDFNKYLISLYIFFYNLKVLSIFYKDSEKFILEFNEKLPLSTTDLGTLYNKNYKILKNINFLEKNIKFLTGYEKIDYHIDGYEFEKPVLIKKGNNNIIKIIIDDNDNTNIKEIKNIRYNFSIEFKNPVIYKKWISVSDNVIKSDGKLKMYDKDNQYSDKYLSYDITDDFQDTAISTITEVDYANNIDQLNEIKNNNVYIKHTDSSSNDFYFEQDDNSINNLKKYYNNRYIIHNINFNFDDSGNISSISSIDIEDSNNELSKVLKETNIVNISLVKKDINTIDKNYKKNVNELEKKNQNINDELNEIKLLDTEYKKLKSKNDKLLVRAYTYYFIIGIITIVLISLYLFNQNNKVKIISISVMISILVVVYIYNYIYRVYYISKHNNTEKFANFSDYNVYYEFKNVDYVNGNIINLDDKSKNDLRILKYDGKEFDKEKYIKDIIKDNYKIYYYGNEYPISQVELDTSNKFYDKINSITLTGNLIDINNDNVEYTITTDPSTKINKLYIVKDKDKDKNIFEKLIDIDDDNINESEYRTYKKDDVGTIIGSDTIIRRIKETCPTESCLDNNENFIKIHIDPSGDSHYRWLLVTQKPTGRDLINNYQAITISSITNGITGGIDSIGNETIEIQYLKLASIPDLKENDYLELVDGNSNPHIYVPLTNQNYNNDDKILILVYKMRNDLLNYMNNRFLKFNKILDTIELQKSKKLYINMEHTLMNDVKDYDKVYQQHNKVKLKNKNLNNIYKHSIIFQINFINMIIILFIILLLMLLLYNVDSSKVLFILIIGFILIVINIFIYLKNISLYTRLNADNKYWNKPVGDLIKVENRKK